MYEEEGVLGFITDNGTSHFFAVRVSIAPDDPELDLLPSLLGRDVISRWRIDFDPSGNRLVCEIISSDRTIIR